MASNGDGRLLRRRRFPLQVSTAERPPSPSGKRSGSRPGSPAARSAPSIRLAVAVATFAAFLLCVGLFVGRRSATEDLPKSPPPHISRNDSIANDEDDRGAAERRRRRRRRRRSGASAHDEDRPWRALWPKRADDDDVGPFPVWAYKKVERSVPPEEEVCFVHVGKAGGSTIGCLLGFSLFCEDTEEADGTLPKVTGHLFHMKYYDCHDSSKWFLFMVRDPVDRIRSAFDYARPERILDVDLKDGEELSRDAIAKLGDDAFVTFYADCPFLTFEDYVRRGLAGIDDRGNDATNATTTTTSEACRKLARDVLRGTTTELALPRQFFFNYQYYLEGVPPNASILAIRNERMAEDWDSAERIVAGDDDDGARDEAAGTRRMTFPRNNVNEGGRSKGQVLDGELMATLCRELCNEIRTYETILRRARNVDEGQVEASMAELGRKCPKEAAAAGCPDPLPDIGVKLRDYRGYLKGEGPGDPP